MSEEILKALMQLFAIIAKQDEGVERNEIKYVHDFLTHQLNDEDVKTYMSLFYQKAGIKEGEDPGKIKNKPKLTSVKDSVRILGLCKKINKKLNQRQKVVVLVRLFELVNADRKFSDQRMAIINTVAEVFNIEKEEFNSIETFVIKDDYQSLDLSNVLIVDEKEKTGKNNKYIKSEALDGAIVILQITSVDLYFLRYTGSQELYLNGLSINNRNIYLFASGSTVKMPKGKPIYYSDVVSNFMADTTSVKLSYVVRDIDYYFPTGNIGLRNIAFSEGHGRLIGIMGASGAGKTTMLNVLSGINKPSNGEILINGIDLHKDNDQIEGIIGYIPQDDLLIEELTVFQNLYFSAKQCFNDKTEEEITELVNKTLKNLGLYERKDLKVGSPLKKMISGGQRKRLNIALELIREPAILFVDEPTSGLSSRDSENVMDLLRELTLKGKLIFVVIHQPSSDIYKMFDKMMILDTGGYLIYYGNPVESIMYFKRIDKQINAEVGECPVCGNVNPELIFNIVEAQIVDEFGNYTDQRKVTPPKWEEYYKSLIKDEKIEEIEEVKEPPESNLKIPTWIKQFKIYTLRDFFSKISNTQYILLTLLEAPLLGFILSYIIRYIADPTSDIYIFRENENIPPYIFMSIIVALFLGLTVSAEEIFRDRKILKREAFLNLSRSSYLMSKVIILFTISAIQSFTFVLIGNSILGIKGMMFEYWYVLFATAAGANMVGLNISSAFNSAVTIYILIPLLMIPQMALGGAMFSFDKLNRTIGSVDKVPIIAEMMTSRWAYEALMVHQFTENEFEARVFGIDGLNYELERQESYSDFMQVRYIPELGSLIDEVNYRLEQIEDGEGTVNADSLLKVNELDFALLKNEIGNQLKKLEKDTTLNDGELKLDAYNFKLDDLSKENYKPKIGENIRFFFDDLSKYYGNRYFEANKKRNALINYVNKEYPGYYNRMRKKYHNEYLQDIVRKVYEKNPILRYKDRLIQQVDPIFLYPSEDNFLGFRTHFYAPKKYFAGKYFNTFGFNIVIIWIITLLFYVTLYYDLLKRFLVFMSGVDFFYYLKKIKNPLKKRKSRK